MEKEYCMFCDFEDEEPCPYCGRGVEEDPWFLLLMEED